MSEHQFGAIQDPALLRRVLEASLLLESNLELPTLLRRIVEEAQAITGARYAALGVLDADGRGLADFITAGLSPEEVGRIDHVPEGRGLLGLLITRPEPIRIPRIGEHPERAGFPPGHPPMDSFLGVPLKVRDEVYGNLYLTDKVGWSEFTVDDEALVVALAVVAGVAVENARLHRRVADVAVYEERDRLARDLHDTVIQRLFAVGLTLQGLAGSVDAAARDRIHQIVADVDDTIRQVRTSIFELGSSELSRGLRSSVLTVVRELRPALGFEARTTFVGPVDTAVPPDVGEHALAVVREAVTNVARHAGASRASVDIAVDIGAGRCTVSVVDDGNGPGRPDPGGSPDTGESDTVGDEGEGGAERGADPSGGLGLANLRHRAEKLGGTCSVGPGPGGVGTEVIWQVPLS